MSGVTNQGESPGSSGVTPAGVPTPTTAGYKKGNVQKMKGHNVQESSSTSSTSDASTIKDISSQKITPGSPKTDAPIQDRDAYLNRMNRLEEQRNRLGKLLANTEGGATLLPIRDQQRESTQRNLNAENEPKQAKSPEPTKPKESSNEYPSSASKKIQKSPEQLKSFKEKLEEMKKEASSIKEEPPIPTTRPPEGSKEFPGSASKQIKKKNE